MVAMVAVVSNLVLFVFLFSYIKAQDTCDPKDQCTCTLKNNREISLWPINSANSARFLNVKDRLGQTYLYDYNPCTTFTKPEIAGECVNVLGCQGGRFGGDPVAIAYSSNPKVNYDKRIKMYTFTYTGSKLDDKRRQMVIRLKCNGSATEPKIEQFLQTYENVFTTTLTSKHACPKSLPSIGIHIGTYLCIFFSVAVFLYVFLGILLNRFARKKTLSDSFPNKTFWIGLPSLIKDGVIFTAGKMRIKGSQYEKL